MDEWVEGVWVPWGLRPIGDYYSLHNQELTVLLKDVTTSDVSTENWPLRWQGTSYCISYPHPFS